MRIAILNPSPQKNYNFSTNSFTAKAVSESVQKRKELKAKIKEITAKYEEKIGIAQDTAFFLQMQRGLPPYHPDVVSLKNEIGNLRAKMSSEIFAVQDEIRALSESPKDELDRIKQKANSKEKLSADEIKILKEQISALRQKSYKLTYTRGKKSAILRSRLSIIAQHVNRPSAEEISRLRNEIRETDEAEAREIQALKDEIELLLSILNAGQEIAPTDKNITSAPKRLLPVAAVDQISRMKEVCGEFIPAYSIKDAAGEYTHFYDMADERNIRVVENYNKIYPKKSRFYNYAMRKNVWAPAIYLASLGFGNLETLERMVEEKRIRGVVKDTKTKNGIEKMLWIDLKNVSSEVKLMQLRELQGYTTAEEIYQKRHIPLENIYRAILEGKITPVREYVFSQDYDKIFLNANSPSVKKFLEENS